MTKFIHLRNASPYSLSRGMLRVREMVAAARQYQMPALALTDRDNFFGAMEFSQTAVEQGIQPIIGVDAAVGFEHDGVWLVARIGLLCQSRAGYQKIIGVMSDAYGRQEPGTDFCMPLEAFENNEGVIALTGGVQGALMPLLHRGKEELANAWLEKLARLFPGRCYVELQRHHNDIREDIIERAAEPMLIDLAFKKSLPLVATNDCHFMTPNLVVAQSVLMCIAAQKKLTDDDHPQLTAEHYFKSPAQMTALFADVPEAIAQTKVIAERCHFILEKTKPIIPVYRANKVVAGAAGKGMEKISAGAIPAELENKPAEEILAVIARDHLVKKLKLLKIEDSKWPEYNKRLDYELSVIKEAGFSDYFLIVADFIRYAKDNGIPVGPGRGSAAGSLTAFSLGITNLDPIHYGLFFERFLNPGRIEMPDVDIDFCQERRDEVLQYVKEKYGETHVAQIITFGSLQARAAIRDVGRVLGHPYGKIDDIAKLIPFRFEAAAVVDEGAETEEEKEKRNRKLPLALQQSPDLKKLYDGDEVTRQVMDMAQMLEGLYRHAATHAAGVVMAGRPLKEVVPLYRDAKSDGNLLMTQFSMKSAELAGLLKFDFLGLTTLSIMDRCIRKIKEQRGIDINLDTIPLDDKKTFEVFCQSKTIGIFQFESDGITDLLFKMQPDRLEHLIAAVALYRPGPMDLIPSYLARRAGKEKIEYDHPSLHQVLAETNGLPIYQEQVIEIARVFAGFSAGDADVFRKAMGKKDKKKMAIMKADFIKGAMEKHKVGEGLANKIFDMVEKFAGYGFNKSHSAAYGLVAYQTAYLKTHYPVEFMAANMTFGMGDTDRLAVLMAEAKTMGIEVLPPNVLSSDVLFEVCYDDEEKPTAINYGLAALKNVGVKAVRALTLARGATGKTANKQINSLWDFFQSMPADTAIFNKRMLESMASAGAFDSIHANRREVFENIPLVLKFMSAMEKESENGTTSLFHQDEEFDKNMVQPLDQFAPWQEKELGQRELESFGFYFAHHPLRGFETLAEDYTLTPINELKQLVGGKVNVLAVINEVRVRQTKAGKDFYVLTLSDSGGDIDINYFDANKKIKEFLIPNEKIFIEVEITQDKNDNTRFYRNIRKIVRAADMVSEKGSSAGFSKNPVAQKMTDAPKKDSYKLLKIKLYDGVEGQSQLPLLRDILKQQKEGYGQVRVELQLPEKMVTMDLGLSLSIHGDIAQSLHQIKNMEFSLEN
ncbi:MAG: DNA polymerase III subunit alpha [Hydrotalea sp.]|nr:DNA polymerase III subunit alpha [Hydrotalea sp.]